MFPMCPEKQMIFNILFNLLYNNIYLRIYYINNEYKKDEYR